MPYLILAEGSAEPTVSTLSGVLDFLSGIITAIFTALSNLYTTITTTPLLFIVVVFGFGGAVIFTAHGILRRLGVVGGKRRKGRRR